MFIKRYAECSDLREHYIIVKIAMYVSEGMTIIVRGQESA